MKKVFSLFNLFGTVFIFLTLGLLQQIALNLDFLNVFEEILEDYNVTDLAFSSIREEPAADTSIVLVNIGNLNRAGIAQQLHIINQFNPAVVGIDVEFSIPRDPVSDSLLEAAFAQTNKLVLWSKVTQGRPNEHGQVVWDSLEVVLPRFAQHATLGYTNALTEGDSQFEAWRETTASEIMSNGDTVYSFATQLARIYAPEKADSFTARNNEYEIINFRGNTDKFTVLDVDDVLDTTFVPDVIEGKIVIMCYLGNSYTSTVWDEDKYYTPLNPKQIGRTPPDMYGGVGHANIVSMILSENYIDEWPEWLSYVAAVFFCFFNVVVFAKIEFNKVLVLWNNLNSKIIQLAEVVVLVFVIIWAFITFNYKIDLTAAIFVILLSGDIFEIYASIFGRLFGLSRK